MPRWFQTQKRKGSFLLTNHKDGNNQYNSINVLLSNQFKRWTSPESMTDPKDKQHH